VGLEIGGRLRTKPFLPREVWPGAGDPAPPTGNGVSANATWFEVDAAERAHPLLRGDARLTRYEYLLLKMLLDHAAASIRARF